VARSSLKGAAELKLRLRAIKDAFKPIGRSWAQETVRLARPGIGRRTGRTARSLRVSDASRIRAKVVANAPALFKDRGTRAHDIRGRAGGRLIFTAGARTIFAKKVHKRAQRGTHFAAKAARQSLRNRPMATTLIELWNKAAR
jgi:hypothetical protein